MACARSAPTRIGKACTLVNKKMILMNLMRAYQETERPIAQASQAETKAHQETKALTMRKWKLCTSKLRPNKA